MGLSHRYVRNSMVAVVLGINSTSKAEVIAQGTNAITY